MFFRSSDWPTYKLSIELEIGVLDVCNFIISCGIPSNFYGDTIDEEGSLFLNSDWDRLGDLLDLGCNYKWEVEIRLGFF